MTFDKLWKLLVVNPQMVAGAVVTAIIMLPICVWLDLRAMSEEALIRQAGGLNTIVQDIRNYYAKNVVSRILASPDKTSVLHDYHDVPGAIPIPATLSIELGDVIRTTDNNVTYRFVSDYAFTSRVPHKLDGFERRALRSFRRRGASRKVITQMSGSIFDRRIRIAAPVVMGGACVTCHNSHQQSPKRDWRIGDVRGLQEISVKQPIAKNLFSFTYLFLYMTAAGAIGLAFAGLQWRQAHHFHKLNGELEEANSFLASVSMKIAKYLPPQIYKSIFSGEKDVVIATERKKLTIFFSDIKDFTLASQHLQPEELTQLLNEYFTEMSKIAMAHGATVDKFIGDAILAFFGDPETKGAKEDAMASVHMALAMQRRLVELNKQWKKRGIERPFLVRIGINTGYCNVGNFGSIDRMDYTIIGAEANLAARLQSIAEPGGIVVSYETFALVKDRITASPLEEITLKGITRPIIPYAVDGLIELPTTTDASTIEEIGPGISLFIDMEGLDESQADQVEDKLKSALKTLKSR